jgi:hypothetical protein
MAIADNPPALFEVIFTLCKIFIRQPLVIVSPLSAYPILDTR